MRLSTRCVAIAVILCVLFVPLPAVAQDDPVSADKTLSPYFFVEGGDPTLDRLPLKDTRVELAIAGVIADVTVRQVYENRGSRPLHARYVFPASTRAAVYGLTMVVGDVRTVARIRERKQAAREFEAAKSEGKSLTRYTSFIAVQEIVRRTADGAEQVDQPLPMPAGVSDLAVGVTSGAEPDVLWLAAIVVVMFCCVSILRERRRRSEMAS